MKASRELNELERFRIQCRKFKLSDILKRINAESAQLLTNPEKGPKAVRRINYRLEKNRFISQDILITAWWLIDFAYAAILETNDHRSSFKSDDDFYGLYIDAYNLIQSEYYPELPRLLIDKDNVVSHVVAIGSEQAKYQRINIIDGNFNRDMHILMEIMPEIDPKIQVNDIIRDKGYKDWLSVASLLLGISCISTKFSDITAVLNSIYKDQIPEEKALAISLLKEYSANYGEIKNDKQYKRQIFYQKPFVETSSGEIISVSCYLNYFTFEHCIYWMIRNYYSEKMSQDFTNAFGECFEKYLNEVLKDTLDDSEYERLEQSKEKKNQKIADWKICLGERVFLIEQKSTFIDLPVKSQHPDLSKLDKYYKITLSKAIKQLKETQEHLKIERAYKCILVYDDFLFTNIDVYARKELSELIDSGQYLYLTINDLETILYLYKNKRDEYEEIMQEIDDGQDSSVVDAIIHRGIKNNYIEKEKYAKYRALVIQKSKELIGTMGDEETEVLIKT